MNEFIERLLQNPYTCSESWAAQTWGLRNYLENGDLEAYREENILPQVFTWPEASIPAMDYLRILEQDPESIFYKAVLKNTYGPRGVHLYRNVQLDRVQQAWTIHSMVSSMGLDLQKSNEVIVEFGPGTGQMADVLAALDFKGRHVAIDLPLMTVLQNHFVEKEGISTRFLLDDELNGAVMPFITTPTSFLPSNQPIWEKAVMEMSNINFVATYSLTETDAETRARVEAYLPRCSRIYIAFWPGKQLQGNGIDNDEYIYGIMQKLADTHNVYIGHTANGKVFWAVGEPTVPPTTPSLF